MQFRGTLRKLALSALVVGSAGALSGCVVNGGGYADDGYYDDSRDYPPVHPHDGYRYAYPGGLTLIFDSGLGLYGVFGYPDYYYTGGYFYRWDSGYWNRSRYWNRNWERCESRYWPRPIYQVHNHYYRHGRRPQRDWNREFWRDRDRRERRDDRGDGRDRPDRDRSHDGDWRDGRPDGHPGGPGGPPPRGDRDGQGGRDDRRDDRGRGHDGGWNGDRRGDDRDDADRDHRRSDDADSHGGGWRERGTHTVRPDERTDEQARRARGEDPREWSRDRNPVDLRRQPDVEVRRGEGHREALGIALREQAERRAAERAMNEKEARERADRRAAEQADRAARKEAARQRDDVQRETPRSDGGGNGEGDGEGGQRDRHRGDNWRDPRGDRR
jgi:hypothetical protein